MAGPSIRSDIVDVYVYRHAEAARRCGLQFLQMRRRAGTLAGSWQPVMGHVEDGETATEAAVRELAEETGWDWSAKGLPATRNIRGFWQLEALNTYFLHQANCIMMSPCFAVEVTAEAEPVLDHAHDAHRWIPRDQAANRFIWPGQRTAITAILRDIVSDSSPVAAYLSIDTVH